MIAVHADVVGSLLRPPGLLEARKQLAAGAISAEELKQIENRAVDGAIVQQEKVGLEVVTGGKTSPAMLRGPLTCRSNVNLSG